MTNDISTKSPEADNIEHSQQVIGSELMETFKKMRRAQQILGGVLPSEIFPDYPNQTATITPYYMNSTDLPDLGFWSLRIGQGFKSKIQTLPTADGRVDEVKVWRTDGEGSGGAYEPATPAEKELVRSVLNHVGDNI